MTYCDVEGCNWHGPMADLRRHKQEAHLRAKSDTRMVVDVGPGTDLEKIIRDVRGQHAYHQTGGGSRGARLDKPSEPATDTRPRELLLFRRRHG